MGLWWETHELMDVKYLEQGLAIANFQQILATVIFTCVSRSLHS